MINPTRKSVDDLWVSKPTDAQLKAWIDEAPARLLPEFINSIPEKTSIPQHKKFRDYAELVLKTKPVVLETKPV
jgi:hypothetical protein